MKRVKKWLALMLAASMVLPSGMTAKAAQETVTKDITLEIGETYTETIATNETMEVTGNTQESVATAVVESESGEYKDYVALYDHSSDTANSLNSFSTTANAGISLRDAEYTFTKHATDDTYKIYNEKTKQYFVVGSSATSPFSATETYVTLNTITDETTNEVSYKMVNGNRWFFFFLTNMDFNGQGGDNANGRGMVLLEAQANVSRDDIIPGYKRVSEITSGNKYLISYIFDGRVIVLYPKNGSTGGLTKLVAANPAWETMYNKLSTTVFSGTLENAELTYTETSKTEATETTGAEYTGTFYNAATNSYMSNDQSANWFKTSVDSMTFVRNGESAFRVKDTSSERYTIFYLNQNNFNGMSSYNSDTSQFVYDLTVLERQECISADDVLPGYKEVTTLVSGNKYIVAYKASADKYAVLYPVLNSLSYDNMTKSAVNNDIVAAVRNHVSIQALAPGNSQITIGDVVYNVRVPFPVLSQNATAEVGCEENSGQGAKLFDNTPSTIWHSNYSGTNDDNYDNHWVIIDLGKAYNVSELWYLSRPTGYNGNIKKCDIYTSIDGVKFDLVKNVEGWSGQPATWNDTSFEATEARFVKIKVVEASSGEAGRVFSAASEIQVRGSEIEGNSLAVTVESIINNIGTTSVAPLTGSGSYCKGEDVTVTAPEKSGYDFMGWYAKLAEGNDYTNETALSTEYSYDFIATEDAELVAVYKPDGKVTLTITDATNVTVTDVNDNALNIAEGILAGTRVKLTCAVAEGNFLYWKNASGKIVSTKPVYEFDLVNNTTLTPVVKSATTGSALVEFVNEYNQVLSVSTWDKAGSDALSTTTPSKLGYDFKGWALEATPTTVVDAEAVRTEITGGATHVRLVPVYAKAATLCNVTYNDGTGSKKVEVALGETYTVTAGTVDGQKFSHWAIGNEIVSYNTSYTFLVTGDVTLTAVFVAENETVAKASILEITSQYEIKNGETVEKVAFVASREIAEGYTLLEHGMLYARNSEIADANAFVEGADGVNKFTATGTGAKGALTLNVRLGEATSIKVRAYAIVKNDTTGEVTTLYSDMATYPAQQ